MNFNNILNLNVGSYQRPIPLTNSFGIVYPVLADDILAQLLNISENDKVLDIGGGSNPFSRANVVTEPYLENSAHRSGLSVKQDINYVQCFAEKLPFRDKEFDFAISRQVFEHTNSPKDACEEIMRVAKRGFIETPQKKYELLSGPNPSHNWFVSVKDNTLIFERRKFIRHPFRQIGLSAMPSSPEGQILLHWEFKNLTNVQFYWENKFEILIIDDKEGFDYSNSVHASEAHLDVAICGLLHGGHYLQSRESDAREAVRLRPDWALAHNTLGVILWRLGKIDEAKKEFQESVRLENRDEFKYNSKLSLSNEQPIVVDFDYSLPMDVEYFKKYISADSVNIIKMLEE